MCVCIRSCLAVIATAVLVIPQSEGFPIEPRPSNESQPPKLPKSESEETPGTPSITDNVAGNPTKEDRNHLPTADFTSVITTGTHPASNADKASLAQTVKAESKGGTEPPATTDVQPTSDKSGGNAKDVISEFSIAEVTKPVAGPPSSAPSEDRGPNNETPASESDHLHNSVEKEAKVAAPPISAATACTKPADSSPAAVVPPVQPAPSTEKSSPKTSESGTASKVTVPQINAAAYSEGTKPVLAAISPSEQEKPVQQQPSEVGKVTVPQINAATSSEGVKPVHAAISSPTQGEPVQHHPTEVGKATVPQINAAASAEGTKPVLSAISPSAQEKPVQHQPTEVGKVVVPEINAAATEIGKPVAASSTVGEPVLPTDSVKTSEHAQSVESSKDDEPKIDGAPVKIITPVTVTPQLEAAHESTTGASADLVSQPSNAGVKVGESVSSSVVSEGPKKLPPSSIEDPQSTENNKKGQAKERDVPEGTGDQPLTTVITPVHALQSKEGEKITDVAKEDAVKVPEGDGARIAEPSTEKKPNAYTITPNEFAKKTAAVVQGQKPEDENKDQTTSLTEETAGKQDNHPEPENPTSNPDHSQTTESTVVVGKTGSNVEVSNKEQNEKTPQVLEEDAKSLKSSSEREKVNLINLHEIANTIIKDYNIYNNEVTLKWKERREKISWVSEANEVLQTYNDKITETEKYSNKCTTGDRQEYEKRKHTLEGIMEQCEKTMQRKSWHELQVKTSEKIREIESVVKNAEDQISQIPKEEKHFNDRKLVIEDQAKRKLQDLNAESTKKAFSDLKADVLRADEDAYKKCIDSKEKEGTVFISETRMLIMKIFNCGVMFD